MTPDFEKFICNNTLLYIDLLKRNKILKLQHEIIKSRSTNWYEVV